MKIRILKIMIAVCLIFSAAFTALWVRSDASIDSLLLTTIDPTRDFGRGQLFAADSTRGSILLGYVQIVDPPGVAPAPIRWHFETIHHANPPTPENLAQVIPDRGWDGCGFGFVHGSLHSRTGSRTLTNCLVKFPDWFASLIWLIIAISLIRRVLKHRKAIVGNLCLNCGYDLRASPGRCPECGTWRI